jgi:hypothetical protein
VVLYVPYFLSNQAQVMVTTPSALTEACLLQSKEAAPLATVKSPTQ